MPSTPGEVRLLAKKPAQRARRRALRAHHVRPRGAQQSGGGVRAETRQQRYGAMPPDSVSGVRMPVRPDAPRTAQPHPRRARLRREPLLRRPVPQPALHVQHPGELPGAPRLCRNVWPAQLREIIPNTVINENNLGAEPDPNAVQGTLTVRNTGLRPWTSWISPGILRRHRQLSAPACFTRRSRISSAPSPRWPLPPTSRRSASTRSSRAGRWITRSTRVTPGYPVRDQRQTSRWSCARELGEAVQGVRQLHEDRGEGSR